MNLRTHNYIHLFKVIILSFFSILIFHYHFFHLVLVYFKRWCSERRNFTFYNYDNFELVVYLTVYNNILDGNRYNLHVTQDREDEYEYVYTPVSFEVYTI